MRTDLSGGTLAARLRSGPLERAELDVFAVDLLETLGSLHAAGKLYGDLNPDTIGLDRHGRLQRAKLGTQRGAQSPSNYLAPEVRDGGPAGVTADLFAAGVVLSECAGPDAPLPLLVLVGMLTSELPDLRPASASEALALLGNTAPAAPVQTAPVPVPVIKTVPIQTAPAQSATAAPPAATALPVVPDPVAPPPGLPVAGQTDVPPLAKPTIAYRQSFEKPKAPVPAPAPADVPTEAIQFPPVVDFPRSEPPVFAPTAAAVATVVEAPAAADEFVFDYDTYVKQRRSRRFKLGGAAAAVVAIAAAVTIGLTMSGGSDEPASTLPQPADAQLGDQLTGLDQAIDQLGK